jgi:hypothetical protein
MNTMTVQDVREAAEVLRKNDSAQNGHYFFPLPPGGLGRILKTVMAQNTAKKWKGEEDKNRYFRR